MYHHEPILVVERDLRQVWDLLTDSYMMTGSVNYWSFCRFEEFWVFTLRAHERPDDLSTLAFRLHLWRDDAGALVGLALAEASRDVYVITHPRHQALAREIYAWVEETWAGGLPLTTYAEASDAERLALLAELGYELQGESEYMRTYDLARVALTPQVPPGFAIHDVTVTDDYAARDRLGFVVFHPDEPLPDSADLWLSGVPGDFSYVPELDLAAYTAGEEIVAFACGWIDRKNHVAEVEPVGTRSDYRQRGLAKAVITECFKRLAARGVRTAHIASGPEPVVSNRLYDSLGPVAKQRYLRWRKTWDQV